MATAVLLPSRTPTDYHRIISPTLKVPVDQQIPVPVGLLACQRDPLLRFLETTVVCSNLSQPAAPPLTTGKNKKKAVIAPTLPDEPVLEVILQDTVIFPEGGGQPTDQGTLTTQDGQTWAVISSKRHGGHAVHYVLSTGKDIDSALLSFVSGCRVSVSLDDPAYARRYDHMSMHTSQHLLSALLESRLKLPTLSWSLTAAPSPCYVELPRGMTAEEINSIQNEANKLVFEGRRVHIEVEELASEHTKEAPTLESGRSVGRGLPQDYTGGVNRVVVIDGVDRNPCCGTHLPSLHNLQLYLLPHTESVARSKATSTRLYFLAGTRLIDHLSTTHALLTSTASSLSCGAPQVPERVNQLGGDRKRAQKRVDDLENELARLLAKDLLQELAGHDISPLLKHIHRTDDTANPLTLLNAVASVLLDGTTDGSQVQPFLFIFSSSPSALAASSVSVVFVLGSDTVQVKTIGDKLKSTLGVKGGGQGTRFSGKFVGVWTEKHNTAIDEILRE